MSAIRFKPNSKMSVVAGWLSVPEPGRYYLDVYIQRQLLVTHRSKNVDDLRQIIAGAALHTHVPPGFWRYLERQEGTVFYWWDYKANQWMRIDEQSARIMRGRAGIGRDGKEERVSSLPLRPEHRLGGKLR